MADLLGTTTPWDGELKNEEKTWAMLAHLSGLSGFIIPFGNFLGPLICWQVKKNESGYVDEHGKESMNYAITVFLAYIVCGLLACVVVGIFLLPIVAIYDIVLRIMGTIKSNEGNRFAYPFTIRFIK